MPEPTHVDEPQVAEGYASVLSQVAAEQRAVVVRRGGADLAAVVPLEYLELMQDAMARHKAEQISRGLDWDRLIAQYPPSQEWFERDEPKPF